MKRILALAIIACSLAVSAPPAYAQNEYHGYIGTVQIVVGTDDDGNFGYVEDSYGQLLTPSFPARFFSDRNVRPIKAFGFSRDRTITSKADDFFFLQAEALPWETDAEIPYPTAPARGDPPSLWIRMQVRQGSEGEVIQLGQLWRTTRSDCPAANLCWKALQPQPRPDPDDIGNLGIETPEDKTVWAIDFFDAEAEAVNNAGGGASYITIRAGVQSAGGVTTLRCQSPSAFPCYVDGGYPPELIGNVTTPYDGRLLSIASGPDKDTITLTTDPATPFNEAVAARYSVTLVNREGERIGLPADMKPPGASFPRPDTLTIDLVQDSYTDEELRAVTGQFVTLVFSNEGMSRLIERTPGPRPGLMAQLILGLVGGVVTFTIAGVGRFITPARELIATAVVAASMSILPAMNWGGSWWFVGAVVVLMLVATAGLTALKGRSG